ncbi:MAG: MerR family transcriptional regulator [Chitinophaga sp.]|mgnify:CR=1 FL=1|jgi:MerR family transcriptional regulator, copper efflux regulator|nr:MerR family transcriptional regulator [Chitinophaga sp.]
MLISELSKQTGITAHTIRFYEKSGLIKGKRDEKVKTNNYFHYDEDTVEKLVLIRDAKSVGFTINEISQLIEAWYNNKMTVAEKLAVLNEKLLSIDERIKQLKEMKKMISQFKKDVITDNC